MGADFFAPAGGGVILASANLPNDQSCPIKFVEPSRLEELCGVFIGCPLIPALFVRTDVAAEKTPISQSAVKRFLTNGRGVRRIALEH